MRNEVKSSSCRTNFMKEDIKIAVRTDALFAPAVSKRNPRSTDLPVGARLRIQKHERVKELQRGQSCLGTGSQ